MGRLEEGAIRGLLTGLLGLAFYATGLEPARVIALSAMVVALQMLVSESRRTGWEPVKTVALGVLLAVCVSLVEFPTSGTLGQVVVAMLFISLAFLQSGRELRWLVPFSLVPLAFSSDLHGHSGVVFGAVWFACAGLALIAVDRLPDAEVKHLAPNADTPPEGGVSVPAGYYRTGAVATLCALGLAVVIAPALGRLTSDRIEALQLGAVDYWGFDDSPDLNNRGERTNKIVMWVTTREPTMLRGRTFERWDGQFWQAMSPQGTEVPAASNGAFYFPRTTGPSVGIPAYENVQSVTFARGGTDILFSAFAPTRLSAAGATVEYFDDGTIRADHPIEEGETYTVVSRQALVGPSDFREHDPIGLDYNAGFEAAYLDTTAVTPRVQALALEITADAPTAYDKVVALETWFDDNMEYRLDSPVAPEGVDPIEFLLFDHRQGYCEQIGTAMVAMARSVGIPARLASGFLVSEFSSERQQYVVRSKDAHAWADIYFPNIGWQGFDPTAGVELSEEEINRSNRPDGLGSFDALWPIARILGLVGAAMALVGGLVVVIRRRRARAGASWDELAAHRLTTIGTVLGRPPAPAETMRMYGEALERELLGGHEVGWVGSVLDDEAFSAHSAPLAVQEQVAVVLTEVERTMTAAQRAEHRMLLVVGAS